MEALVSIIMGSTSDLPVMEKAARVLNDFRIPFEMNALSAHRTPEEVEQFAKAAAGRGIKVIIAAAGMAAHLPGVIASMTPLPVIGVPVNASLQDSIPSFPYCRCLPEYRLPQWESMQPRMQVYWQLRYWQHPTRK